MRTTRKVKIATEMGIQQKEHEDLKPEHLGPRLYCLTNLPYFGQFFNFVFIFPECQIRLMVEFISEGFEKNHVS